MITFSQAYRTNLLNTSILARNMEVVIFHLARLVVLINITMARIFYLLNIDLAYA